MTSQTSPADDMDLSINAPKMPSLISTCKKAMEIDQISPISNTLPEGGLQETDGKLTAPETSDSPVGRMASPDVESNDVELPALKPNSVDQKAHYSEVPKSEIPDSEAISQASSPEFGKGADIEMSDGELAKPVHIMDQGAISEVSKDSKEFIDVNIAGESIPSARVVDPITLHNEEAKSIQLSTPEIIAASVEGSNLDTRGEADDTLSSPADENPSILLSSRNLHYVRATEVRDSDDDDDDDVRMDEAYAPPSIVVETRHIQQSASVIVDDPLMELSIITSEDDGLLTVAPPLVEAHFPIITQEPSSGTADSEVTDTSSTQNHTPETIKEESSTGAEDDYVITTTIQPPGACLLPIETQEIQTSVEQFLGISDDGPEGKCVRSTPILDATRTSILSSIQYEENETTATRPSSSVSKTKQTIATWPTPTKTPNTTFAAPEGSYNKDILITELKAIKIAAIQARNASLEAEIASKRAKLEGATKELENPAAETVQSHIKLLHDYNDIRDVGQGLVGMIADNRGVRIGELYEEFGVGLKD